MPLPPLIPLPDSVEPTAEAFRLTADATIVADESTLDNAAYLQRRLSSATGFPLPIAAPGHRGAAIVLGMSPEGADPGDEGYTLEVTADAVRLEAATQQGLFHAIQTLLQFLPPEIEAPGATADIGWTIPGVRICDRPRFAWRGFMLDEGRHFHGKETVLALLDVLATLKLNVFHWHLTEDQGWRIEIEGYPRLTEVGAKRPGTARHLTDMLRGRHDGRTHSGFYTRDEIREVVACAAERHITVVPEIEMPGHSLAALAAYPELGCRGGPYRVGTRFGIFKDIYCAGRESTFEFLEAVLDQVIELFPGPYIHIGGDEAPKARWNECPDCRRRMAEEGLADAAELQTWFTNRIARHLAARGRIPVGWNEALAPGLHPDAIIQYWIGRRRKVVDAIRQGRRTIVSPFLDYYLDHAYSLTPLSRTYRLEPVFPGLGDDDARNILGVEAPLWTEFVPSRARLDYQTFPRLLALAETGWTSAERKDFGDFLERWTAFRSRLDQRGIRYASAAAAEPAWFRRLFRILTLVQPQRRTAD
jgi:hexosaminidase